MTKTPPNSTTPVLRPATWPIPLEPVTLVGSLVRLEPISPDQSAALAQEIASAAGDDEVWRFLVSDGRTPAGARDYVADLIAQWTSGDALPFVARLAAKDHPAAGTVVGVTRLKDAARAHRRFGVGSWFTRNVWGTGVNTEAKGLLLAHAFEQLGALRVEFDTDARNVRSRSALVALGAVEEGVLRAHRITRDGRRRDSVVFSIIADEWPAVRARIAERVAEQATRGRTRHDVAISLRALDESSASERA